MTQATTPDEERARRKNERELWLLLIGAMLTNKSFKSEVLAQLSAGDCPHEDLGGFFGGIQNEDAEQAWSWAKRLGAERVDEKTTIPKATLTALKESTLRRACQSAAKLVAASGQIESPAKFLELLKEQIKRVEAKL